jgi:hypothetical protein
MNRSELRSRVRTLTNIYSTALLSDSQINDALNDVLLEVSGVYDWPFQTGTVTVSLSPGVATYALSASVREVLLVSSNEAAPLAARKLRAISVLDADSVADTGEQGRPTHYTVVPATVGFDITFYPTPGETETLRVRYTTATALLSSDSSSPVFDAEFHPVLAYAAAARLLTERSAPKAKVQAMDGLAGQFVERMRRFYITSSDRAPVAAGRRRWRR